MANKTELLDALEAVVSQHCTTATRTTPPQSCVDSFALTADAQAMRLLAEEKRLIIDSECGRRVIGHWPGTEPVKQ